MARPAGQLGTAHKGLGWARHGPQGPEKPPDRAASSSSAASTTSSTSSSLLSLLLLPLPQRRFPNLVALRELLLSLAFLHRGLVTRTVSLGPLAALIHVWTPVARHPGRPPLVLIHGFGGDAKWQWERKIGPLSRSFDLYIPDLVFFGRSRADGEDQSVGFQARCMVEAMQCLGVERYAVHGGGDQLWWLCGFQDGGDGGGGGGAGSDPHRQHQPHGRAAAGAGGEGGEGCERDPTSPARRGSNHPPSALNVPPALVDPRILAPALACQARPMG